MTCNRRTFLASAISGAIGTRLEAQPTIIRDGLETVSQNLIQNRVSPSHDDQPLLDVALFLDVEDIFSPAELGNDDSIKELATILHEEGLRANFLFIGDRAQLLAKRKRLDVIDSMASHEVGLHTKSARHPTSPEYTAGKTWKVAVNECLEHEREGVKIIEQIFNKRCVALSGHATFDTPHSQRAAAILGLPYIYAYPAAPPLYNLSWYAGALGFPCNSPTLDSRPILSYFGGFDDQYQQDDTFYSHLKHLDDIIKICLRDGQPYLTLFLCHPQKVRLKEFIDFSWSVNGVNLPEELWGMYGRPMVRTVGEVKNTLLNFRRLAHWLRMDSRLNILTIPEVVNKYGQQPSEIKREDLLRSAQAISASSEIALAERFSPAELLIGMARGIVDYSQSGTLPSVVPRMNILGPMKNPIRAPERKECTYSGLLECAHELLNQVTITGYLPSSCGDSLERIGINHLYKGLAKALLVLNTGSTPAGVTFERTPSWPAIASGIGSAFLEQFDGPLMDPDLNVNTMYRDSRLQTWTLKPALAG